MSTFKKQDTCCQIAFQIGYLKVHSSQLCVKMTFLQTLKQNIIIKMFS